MFSVKNSINVLIGKNVSRTASVQVTDPSATSTYIADGEIVVLNSSGTELTPGDTVTESPWIQIVQRSGSNLVRTAVIDGRWVTAFNGQDGVAAQEQITFVGFNGTSGDIDTTAEHRRLTIEYTFDEELGSEQLQQRIYPHDGVTPSQDEIAETIARQINLDQATKVKAEILLDAAADPLSGNILVSNGSPTVTTVADETGNIAAGDYLRIGAEDTVTVGVYKVAAVTTTTITLTMPYQGATATVLAANTGNIDTAVAIVSDAGIKLTGLPLKFVVGFFKYLKTTFRVVLPSADWGSTLITNSQTAGYGTGVYEQVAELEWFAIGEQGALNRTLVPLPVGRHDATSGVQYDVITIHHFDASDVNAVSGSHPSPKMIYIFPYDGSAQETDILAQLNPWMASTQLAFNNITL